MFNPNKEYLIQHIHLVHDIACALVELLLVDGFAPVPMQADEMAET